METIVQALRNEIRNLFLDTDCNQTGVPCVTVYRFTEARRLMLDDSKNVTEASIEVGYESVSQFIRDYRKMFGFSPKEDILNIQKHLKK